MAIPLEQAPKMRFVVLRTIALYKLVKVILLLLVAYGELRLRDASLAAKLLSWAQARPYGLEHRVVAQLLEWFSGLSVSRIYLFRLVDGKALGGVADHHYHGFAHPARGVGNILETDDRQGFDPACECRGRRL